MLARQGQYAILRAIKKSADVNVCTSDGVAFTILASDDSLKARIY